jgi:hypothetical protein
LQPCGDVSPERKQPQRSSQEQSVSVSPFLDQ